MKRFASVATFGLLGATLLLAGCGGGSSTTIPGASATASSAAQSTPGTTLSASNVISAPSDDRSIEGLGNSAVKLKCNHGAPLHGPCVTPAAIPSIGGYSGTIVLPSGSGTLTIVSSTATSYAPLLRSTPILYVTITARNDVVINGTPGFTLSVPGAVSGLLSIADRGALPWRTVEGPARVVNGHVSFAPVPGGIKLAAGQSALFALHGASSPQPTHSAFPTAPPSQPSPTPVPTTAPVTTSVSGTVVDFASGAALSGFTVTVGAAPDMFTCMGLAQGNSTVPCGVPMAPTQTTTTAANGFFSVSGAPIGMQMIVIAKDATYATLHRTATLTTGINALGTLKITALDASHQAWLADWNSRRATVSFPTSYANMIVDEYAQEQATKWAADYTASGLDISDAGYGQYQTAYSSSPGSMYGAAGVLDVQFSVADYTDADFAWFNNEKPNCPGGNWATCPFADNTGHYMNGSNLRDVWVGLGDDEQPTPNLDGFGPAYYYDVMIVTNGTSTSTLPLSGSRAASASVIMRRQ